MSNVPGKRSAFGFSVPIDRLSVGRTDLSPVSENNGRGPKKLRFRCFQCGVARLASYPSVRKEDGAAKATRNRHVTKKPPQRPLTEPLVFCRSFDPIHYQQFHRCSARLEPESKLLLE